MAFKAEKIYKVTKDYIKLVQELAEKIDGNKSLNDILDEFQKLIDHFKELGDLDTAFDVVELAERVFADYISDYLKTIEFCFEFDLEKDYDKSRILPEVTRYKM